MADEYQAAGMGGRRRGQFTVHPPWQDVRDRHTNVRRYRRYSCAGFVLDAHRQVSLNLLKIDEGSLPEVDQATLALGYPGLQMHESVRDSVGVPGDGPWKVVLPGYVVHALNRTSQEVRQGPYHARSGDERF